MTVKIKLPGHTQISVGGETLDAGPDEVFTVHEDYANALVIEHGGIRMPHDPVPEVEETEEADDPAVEPDPVTGKRRKKK
jgi:hypothetical protein